MKHKTHKTCTVALPRTVTSLSITQPYDGAELRPDAIRPGAMTAFTLPSRTGDRLRYRDGQIKRLGWAPALSRPIEFS